MHSQGLVSAEAQPEILREGMVVAFEPSMFLGPGQYFNIEDVTLVTKDGYEVLAPLPYDAAAIEASMRPVKRIDYPRNPVQLRGASHRQSAVLSTDLAGIQVERINAPVV